MHEMGSPVAGFATSTIAMILGLVDVSGLVNAFLYGLVGAIAGFLFDVLKKLVTKWIRKKETS